MTETFRLENLCYLLWSEQSLKREDWVAQLAGWAGCTRNRAAEILESGELRPEEQDQIVSGVGTITAEELQFERLLEKRKTDVLNENVRFLISGLAHGKKTELAHRVGVTPTTVARWNSGEQVPSATHQQRISEYFQLPQNTDLEEDALFLSPLPVGTRQIRNWLHLRIDGLKPETLQELYPALARLLRNS